MMRIRRKTRSKVPEEFSSPIPQSLAALLIGFIFFLYAVGFLSSVLTLPEVDNHLLHNKNSGTLHLSKYRQEGYDDNDDDSQESVSEKLEREDSYDDEEKTEAKNGDADEDRDSEETIDDGDEVKDVEETIEEEVRKKDIGGKEINDQAGVTRKEEVVEEKKELIDGDGESGETPMERVVTLPETSVVPKSIWPVTIKNEDGKWEDIDHPGDSSIKMTVPMFWSLPIHDQKLMPRDKAMKVGTCITPDTNGDLQRGDACELKDRTIFVAIASYRDWQCRFTLESIFTRAKYPQRLRVGVVDQILDGDYQCDVPIKSCDEDPSQALCTHADQVDVLQTDAKLSVGPVLARHLGHRLYRGEYYAMQLDAHVTFTQDWDIDIIEQHEATNDDMAVLTFYLSDILGSIDEATGKSLKKTRPIMCNTDYEKSHTGEYLRHLTQPEVKAQITGQPQLEPYWAAGFSFARGHFFVNVPYDLYEPMIFQGEEMSIAIRGFTIGYDFFAPERSICFHHYAKGKNKAARRKVNHYTENAKKFKGVGIVAMKRLLGIVHMNPEISAREWLHTEEDRYGIGNARTPEKFFTVFGVDVVNRTTIPHLCAFVSPGIMHKSFMKHLRSDGMGIDYDMITQPFSSYL